MVTKVHGGIYKDQVLTGSLRGFVIGVVAFSGAARLAEVSGTADDESWTLQNGATAIYSTGDAVPNTVADMIARVVEGRATIVSLEIFEGAAAVNDELHIILENAASWGYSDAAGVTADLQTAIRALGATLAVSVEGGAAQTADLSSATAVEYNLMLDSTKGALAGSVGGLGGNEHDQDFGGATQSPA